MSSIEASGLTKEFGGSRRVLSDVSFRSEGVGAIGYLGPNGAGKSTTLKLLTGFLRPTRGTATINGHEVARERRAALADVGSVVETPQPYPSQTVLEAIRMASDFRRGPTLGLRGEVDELHEKLVLPDLTVRTGRLSKGQRQRVVIAGALVGNPSILILDEPTSGLDPEERIQVRQLLRELKKDHLILMSSHLLQEVAETCDEVMFISRGRLLLRDSVENVVNRFRSHVVEVEFDRPVPEDPIHRLSPLVSAVTFLSPVRCRITFDGTRAARGALLRELQRLETVLTFQDAAIPLEDAYLALVSKDEPNHLTP